MENDLMILLSRMFLALDDEVRHQYYLYEKYEGAYPNADTIKILQDAEALSVGKSKALEIMNVNLASDITRESRLRK